MEKIGMIASCGGHWRELMSLSGLEKKFDVFYVTEGSSETPLDTRERSYYFRQINRREPHFLPHFLKLFFFALSTLLEERPDVIISTGALFAYPFCLIAKLMGAKVVYVESFARVTDLSMTGKLVYPFADLFMVQWDGLQKRYPKAVFKGGLL